MERKNKRLFPDEIVDFMRKNAKGLSNKDFTKLINDTFETNFTVAQVDNAKSRYHISSGLTGYFEKGHIPANKGKKMSEAAYKKGHTPHNHRPVGSEREGKDGYIEIKVAEPKKWVSKHKAIYEKHYGTVPKGYKVIFLDRNMRNFNIENLACVSSAELARLNQNHRISEFPEITKAGIVLEKYKEVIRSKKKKRKKNAYGKRKNKRC